MTDLPEIKAANRLFFPNYGKRNTIFLSGHGCRLKDKTGKSYLDFAGGVAVNHLGHCHPQLVAALRKQADQLWHSSNLWLNQPGIRLARSLIEKTFADAVFLCNSGLEANETALKLARKYGRETGGAKKHRILCFENAFHGRSLFTAALSGKEEHRAPFAPLPTGIVRCPYNDSTALRQNMNDEVCAVLLEPIQGEGGVHIATPEFLQEARHLCDQHQSLLILDEVQTGMGRTAKLFAYMHYDIVPDLVTNAKALGGGFPIGAVLAKQEYAAFLTEGSHGSTFGGNPLAAAVASAALSLVADPSLLAEVKQKGEWLREQLQQLNERHQLFSDIRGRGLLIGAQLTTANAAKGIRQACYQKGLLILLAGKGDVLRFAPPLIISAEELQQGMSIFASALTAY